jgi:signal transduction histidine kinase
MAKLFTDSADPITLDVAPLLQQVTKNIRAEFPDAIVTVECPDGISIRAKSQFRQAIEELLTNAIIHHPDDAPEVEITVVEDQERVQIKVADTCPRIPKMERDVLLGNKERTPLDHGSGLGLWFVQFLVSRSNGSIKFEQNSPNGNIVILELPNTTSGG